MGSAIMNFSQNQGSFVRRFGGLSIVILLHTMLAYYLVTTFAYTTISLFRAPVDTKILEEEKPPPVADKLPPPPPAKMAAPPPPYIPLPEVTIQQPTTVNAIAVVTRVAPVPQEFVKTVAVAPAPVNPALPTPPMAVSAPAPPIPGFADLNSCKPDYPRASLIAEEQGTVRVRFVVGTDNKLLEAIVVKSSGYRNLDKATVSALSNCKFKAGYKDGHPVQASFLSDYVWKLAE